MRIRLKINLIIFYLFIVGPVFAQAPLNSKGYLSLVIEGGLRNNISVHSTPQTTFNTIGFDGSGDYTACRPLWNFNVKAGYEFAKLPLILHLTASIQWNQNVHFVEFPKQQNYKPHLFNYRTYGFGVSAEYYFLNKNKHRLGSRLGIQFLKIPNLKDDFKKPILGYDISKSNDTAFYISAINSKTNGLIPQIEAGISYQYKISNSWLIGGTLYYHLGTRILSNTTMLFYNDNTGLQRNSYSVNKGDGFCLNLSLNYRIAPDSKHKL